MKKLTFIALVGVLGFIGINFSGIEVKSDFAQVKLNEAEAHGPEVADHSSIDVADHY